MTVQRQAGPFEECLTRMSGHPAIGWEMMAEECDWSVDMLRKASNPNSEPRVHMSITRAVRLDRLWMRVTKQAPLFYGVMKRRLKTDVECAVSPGELHKILRDLSKEHAEAMDAYLAAVDPNSRGGVHATVPELKSILAELEDVARTLDDAIKAVRDLISQVQMNRGAA